MWPPSVGFSAKLFKRECSSGKTGTPYIFLEMSTVSSGVSSMGDTQYVVGQADRDDQAPVSEAMILRI